MKQIYSLCLDKLKWNKMALLDHTDLIIIIEKNVLSIYEDIFCNKYSWKNKFTLHSKVNVLQMCAYVLYVRI